MGASGWSNKHVDMRELLQMQTSCGSPQAFKPLVNREPRGLNMGELWDDCDGQDASPANSTIIGSAFGLSLEEPTDKMNLVNHSSSPVGGTGIKIRTRQPRQLQQQPNSDNFGTQGTAPRRIRLQMRISYESVCHSEVGGANAKEEEEVESTLTEVRFHQMKLI